MHPCQRSRQGGSQLADGQWAHNNAIRIRICHVANVVKDPDSAMPSRGVCNSWEAELGLERVRVSLRIREDRFSLGLSGERIALG